MSFAPFDPNNAPPPKSFIAYPGGGGNFDLESGTSIRRPRKPRSSSSSTLHSFKMLIRSFGNRIHYFYKIHPLLTFAGSLSFGVAVLVILSVCQSRYCGVVGYRLDFGTGEGSGDYPFTGLENLVMVAGHSIFTSRSCEKVEEEGSSFLEPYQRNPGQVATFVNHIRVGIDAVSSDDKALLLFSGGKTGPRSEAQSYWAVDESRGLSGHCLVSSGAALAAYHTYALPVHVSMVPWFATLAALYTNFQMLSSRLSKEQHIDIEPLWHEGKEKNVRWRALTEEYARDSFENLLFSVCRFRELTGAYPSNISVVSYNFKDERFAHLHRAAIRFFEHRFLYSGTPASSTSKEAALKGDYLVRLQFQRDPYGCQGSLHPKKARTTSISPGHTLSERLPRN